MLSDGIGRHPHRFCREMGVSRRGLNLSMTEELADHRQAPTRNHGDRREGVAQVVDADVLDFGADALPEGLQITERLAGQGAGDRSRVVVDT